MTLCWYNYIYTGETELLLFYNKMTTGHPVYVSELRCKI